MSQIDIHREHQLAPKDAKARVERIAAHLAERFDVAYAWKGETLEFQRSGVDGRIALGAKAVHVSAKLGFFLFALKPVIEREIHRFIDDEFA